MPDRKWGRHSLYAVDATRVVEASGAVAADPFSQLAGICRPWRRFEPPPELPFVGGWVGYLAYEAGRFIEPSAGFRIWQSGSAGTSPYAALSRWALFDTLLVHEIHENRWSVAGVELPESVAGRPRPPLADRLRALEQFAAEAGANEQAACIQCNRGIAVKAATVRERFPSGIAGRWNFSREQYLAKAVRALEYIQAGDIFQVNLARRRRIDVTKEPFEIYERLREVNPATFAAYVPISNRAGEHGREAIVSSSPELFLRLRQGEVVTRPIKGTRPRGNCPATDARARRELAASVKDRAELNMIVDLERNDLGRVCEYGTVRVASDGEIEELPTVFHRTATVTGRLREDADAVDLLRATFPGGSITGAPKVRAMQIINELEPSPRGPYCGAIGCIGLDGGMTLNLAIRTMVVSGGKADVFVGSGIVADSVPEGEYEELEAKAAGMMAALSMTDCGVAVLA